MELRARAGVFRFAGCLSAEDDVFADPGSRAALIGDLAADQMLAGWDFSQASRAGTWYPAHALAPFDMADGVLKTRSTLTDPYMIATA